ncbi:TPA: hypothetical protein ACPZHU_001451 [Yersinia enterocolitica]
MSWYGLGSIACSGTTVTGTGTKWKDNKLGIAAGQALLIPGSGQVVIYEILAVDSDTKIRVTKNISSAITNSEYAIVTTVSNSMSDLARRTAVQLALYQQLLEDWQNITTGTGDVTIIAPDGSTVVIPSLSDLTAWVNDSKTWFNDNRELIENAGEAVAGAGVARDQAVAANTAAQAAKTAAEAAAASVKLGPLGIGLPSMTLINNFDWQNFVFTSGANYLAASTSWINTPAGVGYPTALAISITVDYITVSSNQIGLTLIPNTATSVNFKVYKVLSVGAAGSRVFTVREEWNSASPVPITGGGTGANTLAGAQTALGIATDSFTASQITNTTWIPFTLQSGWTTKTGFRSAYRKVLGMVFIDLAVNVPAEVGSLICTLPVGYRPKKYILVSVASMPNEGFPAPQLIVAPDGSVSVYDTGTSAQFVATIFNFSLE